MRDIAVSVREVVGFCHRSGDIDHRFQPSPSAADGQRGHREVTLTRQGDYCAEYPVEHLWCGEGLRLKLRGRADGYQASTATVEEIKTCRIDPAQIAASTSRMHMAQGRLYAAMLAAAEGLPALTVRLVWYQIDEKREHVLEQHYSAAELAEFLDNTLASYAKWLQQVAALAGERDQSLANLPFPHNSYRPGQRAVAEIVYRCVDRGGQLLLEAPTGIGKTMGVLFPALKALATGKHDTVLFCTARHTGRAAAETALQQLESEGLMATRLSLTAKERICFSPGSACRPQECRFARGYYDKLPAARAAALQQRRLDQPGVETIAREHDLCPYQLGLDLLPWSDVVIADQHYAFSLGAALGLLARERSQRWTVLVDEAHNLPSRARSMYSGRLSRALFKKARKVQRGRLGRDLANVLSTLQMLAPVGITPPDGIVELDGPPAALLEALQGFCSAVGDTMLRQPSLVGNPGPLQDAWYAALALLRTAEVWGTDYRCELWLADDGSPRELVLNCIDPSRLLAQRHAAMHATVAFSATLSPADWMCERLGLQADAVWHRCPSPYAAEQLRVAIDPSIDTRFTARESTRPALIARIQDWVDVHAGNCLVFFPAYRYLSECRDALVAGAPGRITWVQPAPGEPAPERPLIELLQERRDVMALCVLGGSYSEGIDLPGALLRSVVIVGPGLPQLGRDTRQQQAWFESRGQDGFHFACLYPALQKVNQALGRVVRSEQDQGEALLIDPRYLTPRYRELLAPQWQYAVAGQADPAGR